MAPGPAQLGLVPRVRNVLESPFTINWNLTYRCPLNCGHCYSRSRSTDRELPLGDKVRVAENIVASHVFEVNIGGGEPGLLSELPGLIGILSSGHAHINLSASGLGMSQTQLDLLVANGLGGLFVSVDSVDPDRHDRLRGAEGCHAAAVALASAGVARGLKVRFSFVVTRDNLTEIASVAELAAAVGAASLDVKRLRLAGNGQSMGELDLGESQISDLRSRAAALAARTLPIRLHLDSGSTMQAGGDCPCGKVALSIKDDGAIIACPYNGRTVLGNATTDSISEVWQANRAVAMRGDVLCGALDRKKNQ